MKISNFIRTNRLLSVLILVVVVLAVYVVIMTINQKNQPVNVGTSLKTEEPISQSPVASQPTAQNQTTPTAKSTTEVTMVIFCLQLDGRQDGHLPALMGAAARNAYPNGLDGANWNLPASSTGDEDYGVMANKVVFAKEAFLKKWGMVSSVAIKCDATQWAAVNLQKGEINGQAAYVCQLK